MGFFGNKKKIAVSSTVYNLAGDEDKRPNFLKATVIGAVIAGKDSLAQAIQDAYATGPGTRLKNFNRWSKTQGYTNSVGLATSTIGSGDNIDDGILATEIPTLYGGTIELRSSKIDPADFSYWADQYVFANHPERVTTDYFCDIDSNTGVITITYADLSTYSFTPTDYDTKAKYLYATYVETFGGSSGSIVTGSTVTIGSGGSFPSVVGWTVNSNVTTTSSTTLSTTTIVDITYSDATPPSTNSFTTTHSQTCTEVHGEWENTTYQGTLPGTNSTYSIRSIMYQDTYDTLGTDVDVSVTTEDIGGGVIKTTTTTIISDILITHRTHRTDTQQIINKGWGPLSIFIYKFGSGNSVLDNMFTPDAIGAIYYPIIPIRLNNNFISDTDPVLYNKAKKAFRKATGGKFDTVETTIRDNPSIGDIDYAYATFGVSLNVKERACKKYLYSFFKAILEDPEQLVKSDYDDFLNKWQAANYSYDAWLSWREGPTGGFNMGPTPEPVVLPYPNKPTNRMSIGTGVNPTLNYNIQLQWNFIDEDFGSGLLKPGAKANDIWLEVGATDYLVQKYYAEEESRLSWSSFSNNTGIESITINWQLTSNSWKRITIRGLIYYNFIYGGHFVQITGKQALEDTKESGFIIPLHEGIYKDMGRRDSTQMATACCFLVFNSYLEVKTPWYATFAFKVILIVAIVVITIIAPPVGAGATKAAMATGVFLGLSGTAALVAGFIVNYVAAAIVTNLIMKAATHVFGVKIGLVIGTIVSIATLQVGNSLLNGQSIAASFSNMMSSVNLLKLTIPIGNAYANYLGSVTNDLQIQSQKLNDEFTAKSKEIEGKYKEMFGDGAMLFDPKLLTEHNAVLGETPSAFLERTLMTGTDIVDMSLDLLHNFVDITLSLELK